MISFGPRVCSDLDAGVECEWLETNGIGGFASSTIACINTRRYHGLLTAALNPPVGRYVLLSKIEETIIVAGQRFDLSANFYPVAVYPQGFQYLAEFRLDPFPIFTWRAGGVEVIKRIFMVHGENTTVMQYEVRGNAQLELRPLIAFRDYHATTHTNGSLNAVVREEPGLVSIEPYAGLPRLYIAHDAATVTPTGHWYLNFEYPRERDRGLDYQEDLFQPFMLKFTGSSATVIASLVPHRCTEAETLQADEIRRRKEFSQSPLHAAADQFIVKRGNDLHTVIAGYHWFADWGRDTMISLPGLTLATGRYEVAREILLAFSDAVSEGMLPNRFPDDSSDPPEYNTVDASLWYFEAIQQYLKYTGDAAFVQKKLRATMDSIIGWHVRGTRYGIHCDEDGLLQAGDGGTQLTWMDARVDGLAVTPRNGKPVEIQALWYNALRIAGHPARAEKAKASFDRLFWNEDRGCLFDCIRGDSRDASIRPNQVMTMSLSFPLLTEVSRAKSVLEVVAHHLLTPVGLRTLSPADAAYKGTCNGDAHRRDFSYHQGTVWPWLLGPYTTACERLGLPRPSTAGLLKHLETAAGLGTISEIFDGDAPHTARGCIAQAWSVAELLRIQS